MSRVLSRKEYSLMKQILEATQNGLKQSLKKFLIETYGQERVVATREYLVAFGDIPVGLVSHMDTVHKRKISNLFYDTNKNVMWSPEGLGADDRAGVYSMLEIVKRGLRPTLIFTTDEEIGGVGAATLVRDIQACPCELNFLIELDRRGKDDCVFYECANEEFSAYIEDFGFKTNMGSFSDISFIAPTWGIAAVNLSIGYENEHSLTEILKVDWMFNTIDKVELILNSVKPEDKFEYIEQDEMSLLKQYYGDVDFFGNSDPNKELCWGCLESFDSVLMVHSKEAGQYCSTCYERTHSICFECGKEFSDATKTKLLCDKCYNAVGGTK